MFAEKTIEGNGYAVRIRSNSDRFIAVFGRIEKNPFNGAPEFRVSYGYPSKTYKTIAAAERGAARFISGAI